VHRDFAAHLDRSRLLEGDRHLLVALSGGLDSLVLLHLLRFTQPRFTLTAAHFDHAMRTDSASDAGWVRGLCAAWHVPLVDARAPQPPVSEAAARDMRYAFLERCAATTAADAILTAHHADDQAETVLFRMLRGTGPAGLRGIPPRRGIITRPLLPFHREELLAYARRVGLTWREDSSNRSARFARNRIRHEILPVMEAVRPGAARRLARLAGRMAEAESAWHGVVKEAAEGAVVHSEEGVVELARDLLLGYHPHVRARVLRFLLHGLGSAPDRAGTRALMEFISSGGSGGGIAVAGGVRIEREFDLIRLTGTGPVAGALPDSGAVLQIPGPGGGSGSLELAGKRWAVRWSDAAQDPGGGAYAEFDPSALRFPLMLRGWRPGDRIRLTYGGKKLKKLFQERRVGVSARGRTPVLADAGGSVVWVAGVARSGAALPLQEQRVFTITVLDGESF
jgi:tRNA(Ile)-lysidine synthase